MKLKSSLIQTQKPVLAQVLQQSISVLMLSSVELAEAIEQELETNPLLEGEIIENQAKDAPISLIQKSLNHLSDAPYQSNFTDEEMEDEIPIPHLESFEEHLLNQLRLEISDPQERRIGELIIGNLDRDGYLTASLDEIAVITGNLNIDLVTDVIRKIQMFDPVGTASRNLQECLTIQLSVSQSPLKSDALLIIEKHWNDLCRKRYTVISQKTKLSLERIKEAAQLIATLEPKPARNFQTFNQTAYVQPDIYVYKNSDGSFKIELNRKEIPLIRINPIYQKLLNKKSLTEEERKFVQEKLTNAINFIKSIQQRGETITNIAKYIVERQAGFFEGNTSSLVPMSLKDIAAKLERNESTISRAIHNKYMDTPLGIFALKFFFSQAVNDSNKDLSSYDVKEAIRKLVDEEDKSSPLSDSDIQIHFKAKNITLARRTINKYRQELDIPPSHQRKE